MFITGFVHCVVHNAKCAHNNNNALRDKSFGVIACYYVTQEVEVKAVYNR